MQFFNRRDLLSCSSPTIATYETHLRVDKRARQNLNKNGQQDTISKKNLFASMPLLLDFPVFQWWDLGSFLLSYIDSTITYSKKMLKLFFLFMWSISFQSDLTLRWRWRADNLCIRSRKLAFLKHYSLSSLFCTTHPGQSTSLQSKATWN